MVDMQIRRAAESDLESLAELAAQLQADPARTIVYLGTGARDIAAELDEIDWRSISAVAVDRDRLLGWLIGDPDPEVGRIYWLGPFVADHDLPVDEWNSIASQLYAECRRLLPEAMSQEEIAIDARYERCQAWAAEHDFAPNPGSLALVLEADRAHLDGSSLTVRPVVPGDLELVGALHERLFPGTHTTGRQLVEDGDRDHVRLVTEIDGQPAGYVAFEFQSDGAGYIDFLGVDEACRRGGFGAELVRAAVDALQQGGATPIHLTVREDNRAARRLYRSLGFREDRVIRPLRRGFTLT